MHRVFISHAKEDAEAASRVCEMLEKDGIRCWLASRDATASGDNPPEILEAIRNSDLVLLVFSASANASPRVLGHMETAAACKRRVLPVRVDDAAPTVTLERYLNLLAPQPGAIAPAEAAKELELGLGAEAARRWRPSRRTWGIVWGVALLAVGLGLGLGLNQPGSTWTELGPSGTVPPPLAARALTYDPVAERLIVFGGETDSTYFNDTWAYDPAANSWTELKPKPLGTVPSPREYPSMAYDPTTRRLIVFGGLDPGNSCLNDTWAYDPAADTWTNLPPVGTLPLARAWHTMVCDSETGKLIMFGGMAGGFVQPLVPSYLLHDTWAYDPSANTWTNLIPEGVSPTARYAHAIVYDPSTRKVILFGGATGTARFNDTWAYDPAANTWTELEPSGTLPSPRGAHSMAYDPSSGRLILFGGGVSQTALFNDTWAYDPATNRWTELKPGATLPSPRAVHSMVFDPTGGRLILFGGASDGATALNDTWVFTP